MNPLAVLRASLLALFAVIAVASNVVHAAAPAPAPIAAHHHQPTGHADHDAPCCTSGTCVGCALPAADLPTPITVAALAGAPHRTRALAVQASSATPPALPPPRA